MKFFVRWLGITLFGLVPLAHANEAKVEFAEFVRQGAESWSVSVTLRHADTGWEHYADAWRVLGPDDKELGRRVLYHPHETEQPFTRSLSGLKIPATVTTVWVEAHDKVHGWNAKRLRVDLTAAEGPGFKMH